MKKFVVVALLIAFLFGIVCVFGGNNAQSLDRSAYLRIHIRAESNCEADQTVKYRVRDRVVEYLTPLVAACESKEQAMRRMREELGAIAAVAEGVLREQGFSYGARASLRKEEFPTRVYESVTLSAGVYDALILELGAGQGDNWWCVVYPPLCFTEGNANIIYKSKIAEIIKKFFD